MTYEQGVRLTTRALAVFLVVWAVSDAVGIPREIVATWRALQLTAIPRAAAPTGFEDEVVYMLRTSILFLTGNILRVALWLMAARWFYYCGPRIQRFFGIEDNEGQRPDSYQPGAQPQVGNK